MLESPRPSPPTFIDRAVGWMLLLSGLALLGLAVVTPMWLEHRQLAWQRDVMHRQAQLLEEQAERYRVFRDALEHDEPVLLARLAYQQFRLKPAGTSMIPAPGAAGHESVRPSASDASVDQWLHQPMPPVAALTPPPPIESHLVRLVRGPGQVVMLGAGLVCLASGLLLGSDHAKD